MIRILDIDDLLLLRYLLHGNTMGKSAKLLNVSQPAITQRVRKMEKHFGEIVERGPHSVTLTQHGISIALYATIALRFLERMEQ